MRPWPPLFPLVVAAALIAPPTGATATAQVANTTEFGKIVGPLPTLVYTGEPGEANAVTVERVAEATYAITDAGATITAGQGCTSVTPHQVRCSVPTELVVFRLGDGNDSLSMRGRVGLAILDGGEGDDVVEGGPSGFDRIRGGPGNDFLRGGRGDEELNGGTGADTFIGGTTDFGDARRTGLGETFALVTYAGRTEPIRIDRDGVADEGAAGEGDAIADDIGAIVGGAGPDTMVGDGRLDLFFGGPGGDVLSGNGSTDGLLGGRGADVLDGGRGGDFLRGGSGDDILRGGPGADGFEEAPVSGGPGDDTILGGAGPDQLSGDRGRDVFYARDGERDHVRGGRGFDRAWIDPRLDRVLGIEAGRPLLPGPPLTGRD